MAAVVHPEFVYREDDDSKNIYHVSCFTDVVPRPSVCCPECHEIVVLALGKINAHHYRHKPDTNCSLKGSRESIMHSNVKFHIRGELERANALKIKQQCVGHEVYCAEERVSTVVSNWSTAKVECPINKFYADVGLVLNDKVIGVVEVWVKHKTEGEKFKFLHENLPWIEVKVDNTNYGKMMAWTCEEALLSATSNHDEYVCFKCKKEIAKELKEEKREKAIKARVADLEVVSSRVQCLGVRDIDFLFRSRKTYRKYLYLYADWRGDILLRTWLQFKGESDKMYELTLPNHMNHVKNFYRKIIAGQFRHIDMPMYEYSMHAEDYYIHDARSIRTPEPPRYEFKIGELPGSFS